MPDSSQIRSSGLQKYTRSTPHAFSVDAARAGGRDFPGSTGWWMGP